MFQLVCLCDLYLSMMWHLQFIIITTAHMQMDLWYTAYEFFLEFSFYDNPMSLLQVSVRGHYMCMCVCACVCIQVQELGCV